MSKATEVIAAIETATAQLDDVITKLYAVKYECINDTYKEKFQDWTRAIETRMTNAKAYYEGRAKEGLPFEAALAEQQYLALKDIWDELGKEDKPRYE